MIMPARHLVHYLASDSNNKNNNSNIDTSCSIPGSMLNAVKFSSHLTLSTALKARNYKHFYLSYEKTKAKKGEIPIQSHTPNK